MRRLYAETAQIMGRTDVLQTLTTMGVDVMTPTPEQFSECASAKPAIS